MERERWQRINDIFHAALAQDSARRSAFLDQACAGDPGLRDEVASLLTAHEQAEGFLESPTFEANAELLGKQLDGREVDFRSDMFSFGTMLYELATGSLPDLATPAPLTPPELDRIVRRCLRRKLEERYEATTDLASELERLQESLRERRRTTRPESPATGDERLDRQQTSRQWWRVHQVSVSLLYVGMLYPGWLVREWRPGTWTLATFLALVAAGATGCTLRWHLLFTERFTASALASLMRRTARWIQAVDYGFAAVLLLMAVAVVRVKPAMAAVLVAVAIGLVLTALVIEPATTRAAFRRRRAG